MVFKSIFLSIFSQQFQPIITEFKYPNKFITENHPRYSRNRIQIVNSLINVKLKTFQLSINSNNFYNRLIVFNLIRFRKDKNQHKIPALDYTSFLYQL